MSVPVIVIHGGAGSRPLIGQKYQRAHSSLQSILEIALQRLNAGASALEVVTLACSLLEDDPFFNAGKGSKIQSDGKIRMSASLMDGSRRRFAGCVNVEGVKNPIRLARKLLGRQDRVLSGPGAQRFAREMNLEFASAYTPEQRAKHHARVKGKTGTVGALALDKKGRLCAATSTGGKGFEYPFRVSDSPTTAGNFANEVCAVSATGTGEEIVEFSAASTICAYVEMGMSLERGVKRLLNRADRSGAEFGVIALDSRGNYRGATTTDCLIWGAARGQTLDIFCN